MRKSTVYTLVVMVIAAMILPACGGATTAAACKAGLVTDVGKVNDGTFNQYAFEGLKKESCSSQILKRWLEFSRVPSNWMASSVKPNQPGESQHP